MEALTRTWTRVAQVAVFTAVILGGAGLGLDVAWTALSGPEAPVVLPTLPEQPRRAAAVKATGLSAEALASAPVTYSIYLPALDTLAGARDLDLLDLDPAVHQPVAIGSYATRAEAESQLARLHQVRGYEAAIAVETHDTPRAR